MSMRRRWVWATAGALLLFGYLVALEAHTTVTNATLAKFCVGQAYPNTWRGLPNQRPAWVTEARLDALCAVTAWLREDLGLALEDPSVWR